MEKLKFPKNFFWGSSTSAYQIEGGIENNDWAQAGRDGRVPEAGRACDSYNRYEEDFDIAKSLGHNAHRFSIEWARIEPEEGKFDEQAIEHYRKVIQALRDRGLEPVVTLWHYTLPIWFVKKGGFANKNSPEIFARYCESVVQKLGDNVKFWMTLNEPMIYAGFSYFLGWYPPFKKNPLKFLKVVNNLVMSHGMAYKKIKSQSSEALVGVAYDTVRYLHNNNPLNIFVANFRNWFINFRFLNKTIKNSDFIGLNYYRPIQHGSGMKFEKTDIGWEIYPKGIFDLLLELKKYNKPVYITENGIADATDRKRAQYIKNHLYQVHRAIETGVDVRGYLYWSLLDNFEWAQGYGPRFGLVEMNYDTMERRIRPSAYEYKKICETNSL